MNQLDVNVDIRELTDDEILEDIELLDLLTTPDDGPTYTIPATMSVAEYFKQLGVL